MNRSDARTMLEAALELASLGWPVFPCVETAGEKAKSPYTRNGFHEASTDPDQIKKWWSYKPNALVGLALPHGYCVIDIDPRSGGSRNALEALCGELPKTLTAWSGRGDGGQHLYFLRPEGDLTSTRLPAGIDLKDYDRGYVIAPPSLHPDTGQPYRWENFHELEHPACMPYRLFELLKLDLSHHGRHLFNANPDDDFRQLLEWVAVAPEGCRNDYLFYAAMKLGEKAALETHEDQLIEAAAATGLGELEIRRTIESARRRVNR